MLDSPTPGTVRFLEDAFEEFVYLPMNSKNADWLNRFKESHRGIVAKLGIAISERDVNEKLRHLANWTVSLELLHGTQKG